MTSLLHVGRHVARPITGYTGPGGNMTVPSIVQQPMHTHSAPTLTFHGKDRFRGAGDGESWTKSRLMQVLFVLIALCLPTLAAETGDIHMVRTCRTNESGSISTREVFTRAGQTNLVRLTSTKAGAVQTQIHRFYHEGVLIGDYVVMKDSSGFTTEAGCPYTVSLEFWPSREVRSVVFGTNGVIVDAFMATNTVFYPADTSVIRKVNGFTGDLSKLLSPSHITNSPPEKFRDEVEQFIQKHQDE